MSSTGADERSRRRLAGRVAVITGVGTGLGREIALVYAEEGAVVVGCDIRDGDGAETLRMVWERGGTGVFVHADVQSQAEVEKVVARAESDYGALHVMTANAGVLGRGAWKSLVDMTEEEIADTMAINFGGALSSFRAAIPAITRAGGGAMTVTTSDAAHRGYAQLPIYCASKGAVVSLVRSLAADLAPLIRVNAVSAGPMETAIREHYVEDAGDVTVPIALGRGAGRAHPRSVALVHAFLASDDAEYINGQAVVADGGRIMRAPR